MRVLGIDPGKRQTWYSSLEMGQVCSRGQLVPVWNLIESDHLDLDPDRPLNDRLAATRGMISTFIYDQRPEVVIAERYIVRPGQGRGNNAEAINIMLGLLYSACSHFDVPCWFILPSVWKQWWDRTFCRDWYAHWPKLNAHQADACSIGIYGYTRFRVKDR
jgi:Holliday junction resolvasome RuvABC endonuclease subunit